MDITKFFPGKKRDLSDQSKEQSQVDPKKVREESQGSCSAVDGINVLGITWLALQEYLV